MRGLLEETVPSLRQGDTLVVARDCSISSDWFLMGTVIVVAEQMYATGFEFYFKKAGTQKLGDISLEYDGAKPRLRFPYKNELKRY